MTPVQFNHVTYVLFSNATAYIACGGNKDIAIAGGVGTLAATALTYGIKKLIGNPLTTQSRLLLVITDLATRVLAATAIATGLGARQVEVRILALTHIGYTLFTLLQDSFLGGRYRDILMPHI